MEMSERFGTANPCHTEQGEHVKSSLVASLVAMLAAINSAKPFTDAGRVKAVANSVVKRHSLLGIPTIGATVPGYDVGIGYGVVVPARTPNSFGGRQVDTYSAASGCQTGGLNMAVA